MVRTRLVCLVIAALVGVRANAAAQAGAPPEGWVVLPIDEYRALHDRSLPQLPTPLAPPVDATLTRVDYDLRLDGDSVAGSALLTIDVLRDGWARVQIPAGLMVRDARLDGQPVSLIKSPIPPPGIPAPGPNAVPAAPGPAKFDGPPYVLLSRAGRSVLTLDVAIPLTASAGAESFVLPASPSPISRATFVMPKTGVDLTLAGGFIADRAESANESQWTAFGRPNQPLVLSWKRKVDDRRADQPLRVRARVVEMVGLGEDSAALSAAVRIEILQGLAREIEAAIPAGVVINQVNGATVADWESRPGTLLVRLPEPSATEVSFVVQAETRAAREGAIDVPIVRIPAAERETGGVAVDVVGAGEIARHLARGFEPADPSELGEIVTGRDTPSMVAFRSRPVPGTDSRSLTVNVVRYTPQAVLIANVEEARYRALASEDGRLLVEARYAVRNNQRSFLKVTMPAGSVVWSAEVAGRPMRPGVAEGAAVLLPLEKGRASEEAPTFVVRLIYFQRVDAWTDKGRARLDLPALDLPISRTGLEIQYSPRYRVELLPGSFRVEQDNGPAAEVLRRPNLSISVAAPVVDAQSVKLHSGAAEASGLQQLVERYRNEGVGRSVAGSLPVHVTFPTFGPSIFLAAELTAEASVPGVELGYRRTRN